MSNRNKPATCVAKASEQPEKSIICVVVVGVVVVVVVVAVVAVVVVGVVVVDVVVDCADPCAAKQRATVRRSHGLIVGSASI